MSIQFNYPAIFTKQKEGGYLIRFPDLPEAITQAESIEEAIAEATDCLEEAIANRIDMKLEIPTPRSLKKGQYLISLPTTFIAKVALYLAMREHKISNTNLAKKLDCNEKEVRRLLDPHYSSKLPRLEEALHLLGMRLQVEVVKDSHRM